MEKSVYYTRRSFKIFLFLLLIIVYPVTILAVNAPVILYTDIVSGPNSGTNDGPGGSYLSIFGVNFGDDINDITVTIGGGEVGAYKHLGTSYGRTDIQWLAVQLGSSCATGSIVVTVAGQGSSNTDHTFTVRTADIYFISLTGSDGGGTVNDITDPFRTPNGVRGSVSAGDFMVVRGGTYDLNDGTNNIKSDSWLRVASGINGSEGNPVTFYGYPGENVIVQIDSTNKLVSTASTTQIDYLNVANFKADVNTCNNEAVLQIGSSASSGKCNFAGGGGFVSHGRIVNIDIDGDGTAILCNNSSGNSPFIIGWSEYINVFGVSVHDTGTPPDPKEYHGHPFYFASTQRFTDAGWNAVYNVPYSRAVVQFHEDYCHGTKAISDISFHDNIIYGVGGQPILLGGATGDITLYNNLIYGSTTSYSDIFALRGNGGKLNVDFYNNTVYADANGSGEILRFRRHVESVTLYNNIFYAMDSGDDFYVREDAGWGDENITSDNNVWYGSSSGLPSFAGPNDKSVDPKFVNAAGYDFRLQLDSQCINSGTSKVSTVVRYDFEGNLRPQDSIYEIGAYESNGEPPQSNAPNPPLNLRVIN